MRIVAVIPARYQSTRFEGKPLADICGRPMIWWVYNQVKKVDVLNNVYVATDDIKIAKVCEQHNIEYIMTRNNHPDHISRVQEVSEKILADYYVCVNGDEPLIEPQHIKKVITAQLSTDYKNDIEVFRGAMRLLKDPAETIDMSNIKLAISKDEVCVYMSRATIPYPKGSLLFSYYKYVGIECFNKKALDFFVNTPMGTLERIEDIDHLRFIENGIKLYFTEVDSDSISVDTPKDLEKVRCKIEEGIKNGKYSN